MGFLSIFEFISTDSLYRSGNVLINNKKKFNRKKEQINTILSNVGIEMNANAVNILNVRKDSPPVTGKQIMSYLLILTTKEVDKIFSKTPIEQLKDITKIVTLYLYYYTKKEVPEHEQININKAKLVYNDVLTSISNTNSPYLPITMIYRNRNSPRTQVINSPGKRSAFMPNEKSFAGGYKRKTQKRKLK